MRTVIRRYSGKGAKELFDLLEKRTADVEELMRSVKGFVGYTLARGGDGGFSVTVCQDKAGIDESVQKAKDWSLHACELTAASRAVECLFRVGCCHWRPASNSGSRSRVGGTDRRPPPLFNTPFREVRAVSQSPFFRLTKSGPPSRIPFPFISPSVAAGSSVADGCRECESKPLRSQFLRSNQHHSGPLLSARHRPVRAQCRLCLWMAQAPRIACSACFPIYAGVSLIVCNPRSVQ